MWNNIQQTTFNTKTRSLTMAFDHVTWKSSTLYGQPNVPFWRLSSKEFKDIVQTCVQRPAVWPSQLTTWLQILYIIRNIYSLEIPFYQDCQISIELTSLGLKPLLLWSLLRWDSVRYLVWCYVPYLISLRNSCLEKLLCILSTILIACNKLFFYLTCLFYFEVCIAYCFNVNNDLIWSVTGFHS